MGSPGGDKSPVCDRRGANFLDYEHQVDLWMRAARAELTARASLLVLRTQPTPRQVCLAGGGDISGHGDGATGILDISRGYLAPEAAGAIRQQVVRFISYRRTDQSIDDYVAEFVPLRSEAESRMEMGAGSPEQFASILRMSYAGLSRPEKSSVTASCQKNLKFEGPLLNMPR